MRTIRILLALLPALLCSCHQSQTRENSANRITGEQTIPLATVEFEGHRYVAQADFGLKHTVPLMIHGNASMFLALTHEVAEPIHGGPIPKVADYGYSSKGKGVIQVPEMTMDGRRFSNLDSVPVFDFTEERGGPVQGMLGVPFLVAARAAVDFANDALILGVPRTAGPDGKLSARGYKVVPIRVTPQHRVVMDVTFPSIGRTLAVTPSTVANALTLHRGAFQGRVPMTKAGSPDRSPSRTSPDLYTSDRVEFELAGVRLASPATFENFAEYANIPESEIGTYGMLGYDWMKAHRAVLDYANGYLYFLP